MRCKAFIAEGMTPVREHHFIRERAGWRHNFVGEWLCWPDVFGDQQRVSKQPGASPKQLRHAGDEAETHPRQNPETNHAEGHKAPAFQDAEIHRHREGHQVNPHCQKPDASGGSKGNRAGHQDEKYQVAKIPMV